MGISVASGSRISRFWDAFLGCEIGKGNRAGYGMSIPA